MTHYMINNRQEGHTHAYSYTPTYRLNPRICNQHCFALKQYGFRFDNNQTQYRVCSRYLKTALRLQRYYTLTNFTVQPLDR
jgi:hypothetical protein